MSRAVAVAFRGGEGRGKGPRGAGFRLGGPRRGRLPPLWQDLSGSVTARERACESPEEVPRLPAGLGVSVWVRERAVRGGRAGGTRAGQRGT